MSNKPVEPFEELPIPRKDVPHLQVCRYRVYTDKTNFVTVEAVSALEALRASGKKQAFRIERDMLQLTTILNIGSFDEGVDANAQLAANPAVPAADGAAAEAAPADAAHNEQPLSSDDVDKLLDGSSTPPA